MYDLCPSCARLLDLRTDWGRAHWVRGLEMHLQCAYGIPPYRTSNLVPDGLGGTEAQGGPLGTRTGRRTGPPSGDSMGFESAL